jgi:heterodisulfide reductase subunit C
MKAKDGKSLEEEFLEGVYSIPNGEKISQCVECGTCVAGCPTGGARKNNFEDVQIFAEIEGVLA